MKTTIVVEGIKCYAYHGCMDEESKIGGWFVTDVSVSMKIDRAIKSDDLSETVDYVKVTEIIREQMAIRSKLIEHVAGRIVSALHHAFPGEKEIEVKVVKLNPPVNSQIGQASVILRDSFN